MAPKSKKPSKSSKTPQTTSNPSQTNHQNPYSTAPLFFFKPSDPNGYLCQWYLSPMHDPCSDLTFNCCEQYMMWHKARTFGDEATMAAVMDEQRPVAQKALGKCVRGFDEEVWGRVKFEVVVRGNLLKFGKDGVGRGGGGGEVGGGEGGREEEEEDEDEGEDEGENEGEDEGEDATDKVSLREMLLATGTRELVEASRFDRVWGIGFDAVRAVSMPRERWGQNLLGKALMVVRERLRAEQEREVNE